MIITATAKKYRIGWRSLGYISALSLFFLLLVDIFSVTAGEAVLKKATLMPLWSPQAQFAGYYVALEKGIFARHGIDLKILKAGPGYSPVESLEDGTADFAILWLTTALRHRSTGIRLINVAQIIQKSSMLLIAKKSSGIRTIADMNNRKVGIWEGDLSIPPRVLFNKHNIKVREVPQTQTVNLFLRGGTDVASAMWYNEYHTILNSGVDPEELNIFPLNEHGMNFPEDGIYVLEKTLKKDPLLVKAFVRASLEGWRYAFDHSEEALDVVIKYMREAQLPANRVHQKWMLDRMRDLIMPANLQGTPGILSTRDYEAINRTMRQYGNLRELPDYASFSRSHDVGEK